MRNSRLLDMESVDNRLLGLIGAGFALILVVAVVGSYARAQTVVPAATIAPVAQQTDLPAVERHNEVARADMKVVRLEPVVIVATRIAITAARAAQPGAPAGVATRTIAANVVAAAP